MDAREYMETVRAAQRGIDRRLAVIHSMRAREQVRALRDAEPPRGVHHDGRGEQRPGHSRPPQNGHSPGAGAFSMTSQATGSHTCLRSSSTMRAR